MKNITLYAVTHKKVDNELPERTLIGVGPNKQIPGVTLYDNTGDNISNKNLNYCELTALYWIWKNDRSDIVGLEHYRRQFINGKELLNKKTIEAFMSRYDVIVPLNISCTSSIYQRYKEIHGESDLLMTREIIKVKYPEYMIDFDYLKETNKIHICNMMIAKKDFVDKYCSWLFDILFSLEKKVDLNTRDDYQKRVFGFLSERLLNVYLHHNQSLKIKGIRINNQTEKYDSQVFPYPWDFVYYAKKILKH